jgi:YD repeat-containing protein
MSIDLKGATTMRKSCKAFPITLFALMLAAVVTSAPAVWAQSEQSQGQQQSPASQTQAEQIVQGQLASVDTDGNTLTIKLPDNSTMQFKFDQNTRVVGSSTGVQGLSSETGTKLAIHYTQQDNQKMATTIEILK